MGNGTMLRKLDMTHVFFMQQSSLARYVVENLCVVVWLCGQILRLGLVGQVINNMGPVQMA